MIHAFLCDLVTSLVRSLTLWFPGSDLSAKVTMPTAVGIDALVVLSHYLPLRRHWRANLGADLSESCPQHLY